MYIHINVPAHVGEGVVLHDKIWWVTLYFFSSELDAHQRIAVEENNSCVVAQRERPRHERSIHSEPFLIELVSSPEQKKNLL